MKLNIQVAVSVRNSDGGTNARNVEVDFDEWNSNQDVVADEAGRRVIQDLTARDDRNDVVRTWTVVGVRRA